MKTYILTEGELSQIATLRGGATLSFSVSSLLSGFFLSVTQGMAFTETIAPVVEATWEAYKWASLLGAIVSAMAGIYFMWKGHSVLADIKGEMEHND